MRADDEKSAPMARIPIEAIKDAKEWEERYMRELVRDAKSTGSTLCLLPLIIDELELDG